MAMSGMEQMMVSLLSKMGIDPEMIKNVANSVGDTTRRINDALVEQSQATARVEAKLDRILALLEPKPDGGYILGTGEGEDHAVQGFVPSLYDKIAADVSSEKTEV